MPPTEVSADLVVEIAGADGERARGHLGGSGGRLTLEIDHPGVFAGSGDAPVVREMARGLAARGVSIRVTHDGLHLVTIGAVSAPWWQRRVTGSSRIRIGSWRGAWTSLRSRAGGQSAVLPDAESLPPPTMLPLVPTFARYPRRPVTTTHTPSGSGSPRLVLEKGDIWESERPPVYWLKDERTTIGSDPSCDIVLPGLAALHTVVIHDDADEYVVQSRGPESRVHGAVVASQQVLRTGARLDVGTHSLAFFREEYADHGRPYGGREGGEIGHQRSQPSRSPVEDSTTGR